LVPTIFIQTVEGSIDAIQIVQVVDEPYKVLLTDNLSSSLSINSSNYTKATYEIVKAGSRRRGSFIVIDVDKTKTMTVGVSAVNYDDRYYTQDKDFINDLVNVKGETV